MPRGQRNQKAVLLIVWKHQDIMEMRALTPEMDLWTLAEDLLAQYPDASHVRWYADMNGLTRPDEWDAVYAYEKTLGAEERPQDLGDTKYE